MRTPTGIMVVGERDELLFANSTALEMLRHLDLSSLLGRQGPLPPTVPRNGEMAFRFPGGRTGIASVMSARTQWGGRTAWLLMIRDITDR